MDLLYPTCYYLVNYLLIVHCSYHYIIQQFVNKCRFNESTLLNYAYPCRNWTFQRFARAAQKKGRNGTNKKSDTRWESNLGPLFSCADAITTKPGSHSSILNNYRPVSNLCFIANIFEKLILSHVSSYLNSHNLCNNCQSAYRPGHSTEAALLKVVNDLFLSPNKGDVSVLDLLDFSSAFDTIDHPSLVCHLHADFGLTDAVLQWFSSYLTDRMHYVSLSNHCSAFVPAHSRVPMGSVLGPILLTMYVRPLSAIIDSHSTMHHSFAGD